MNITPDTPAFVPVPASAPPYSLESPAAHAAVEQWRTLLTTFNDLLGKAPGVREILRTLLADTFKVDPDTTGLVFRSDDDFAFISLTHLLAFVRHHPTPPSDLDTLAKVRGTPDAGPVLANLRPSELYARLATMDTSHSIGERWNAYWQARAAGTPFSRQEHARKQYVGHFDAALKIATLEQTLSEAQLRPLQAVADNPEWLIKDGQQVRIQTLADHPASLIFSLAEEPARVLYRPAGQPVFTGYENQARLEEALSPDTQAGLEYLTLDGVADGFTAVLDQLLAATLATLDHDPGADIRQHAEFALSQADDLNLQRRSPNVFAGPPAPEADTEDDSQPSLFDFGALTEDIPHALRSRQISDLLERLSSLDEATLRQLRDHESSLKAAQAKALAAIEVHLQSPRWHSDAAAVVPSRELVDAHYKALRAHGQIQHLLGQIDATELSWIEALTQRNDAAGSAVCPKLEQTASPATDAGHTHRLMDALVITHPSALNARPTTRSLLVYWASEHGGLLRCPDQAALEQCLGVGKDNGQSLSLQSISGDAMAQILAHKFASARQSCTRILQDEGIHTLKQALPRISQALKSDLQAPGHAARASAHGLLEEQSHAVKLAGAAPSWLKAMSTANRQALVEVLERYISAMRSSRALLARDLPVREAFCRALINRKLKDDFDADDVGQIHLDLPIRVTSQRDPIVGSGAQGVPVRLEDTPSQERTQVPLQTLLLENIDTEMTRRLQFLKVQVASSSADTVRVLTSGLTSSYVHGLATALDLAQAYEDRIRQAFLGLDETEHARAYRRETLLEPVRLMLQIQRLLFHERGYLNDQSQAILALASDARYQADGHDIRLLAARLTSGGPDTDDQPVTLSGVTFIEDQASGVTLLYLPDHPASPVRQYPNLEEARLSLYERSKTQEEQAYLISRALLGNPDAHRSRLAQAHANRFSGIIGLGAQWPASTSLAQLLLDAEMGRLIEANRATSRSSRDLWQENFTYQSGMVFNYLKMALGFIPFVGTAIGLYDVVDAMHQAAKAFTQGEIAHGLDELENAITSLIDAAMDLVNGVGFSPSAALRTSKQRQLRQLKGHRPGSRYLSAAAGQRLKRLRGYEYDQPLSLQGLPSPTSGRWRGVYRTGQGDFILIEGTPFQVEWDATLHTWRLSGNARSSWKMAVGLDELGRWDTHFALHGVHVRGAGGGGGQAASRIADTLEPLWPAAIKARLPLWWRDRTYRLRKQLQDSISARTHTLSKLGKDLESRTAVENALDDTVLRSSLERYIDEARRNHADYERLQGVSSRARQSEAKKLASEMAEAICEGNYHLRVHAHKRFLRHLEEIKQLIATLQDVSHQLTPDLERPRMVTLTSQMLQLRRRMREIRQSTLIEVDELSMRMDQMRHWEAKALRPRKRLKLFDAIDNDLTRLPRPALDYLLISQLTALITRAPATLDLSWVKLQKLMHDPLIELDRALHALHQLPGVHSSKNQRQDILSTSLSKIDGYRSKLRYWQASYGQFFDTASLERLKSVLKRHTEHYRTLVREPSPTPSSPTRPADASAPRVFETTDNHYLIGEPRRQANEYRITGPSGHTEIYIESTPGKFTLSNPVAPPGSRAASMAELEAEANRHLDGLAGYRQQIERYARTGMDGASLEDLMHFKAQDLNDLASQINAQDASAALLARLRREASTLIEDGRKLHVRQYMSSHRPTAAMLGYLLDQQAVDIERIGSLTLLGKRQDGRQDFLQEFVVRDLTQQPPTELWFAHFHFSKAQAQFTEFEAAHLKIPAQRYLGGEWQATHVEDIWRGEIGRPMAVRHFQPLF
ncbi:MULTISPECIES: DUF6543 domain-containing protein [unclassified Pseudomonas]|uniref:dermonecrotic toxin domain-containing protein n=1 Tax=unclassified Pseudomonas TaxID=196821 RepID=UPI0024474B41|nr:MULTISPECIES: DUF6543 domain-containing protein [unclassified Pseudomonas]MDH0303960.1 hypothetical protein [Pseudomonas sp. GD04091]MDH1987352.1 hypothetical protein [Pseudomonas sp. GD03689]